MIFNCYFKRIARVFLYASKYRNFSFTDTLSAKNSEVENKADLLRHYWQMKNVCENQFQSISFGKFFFFVGLIQLKSKMVPCRAESLRRNRMNSRRARKTKRDEPFRLSDGDIHKTGNWPDSLQMDYLSLTQKFSVTPLKIPLTKLQQVQVIAKDFGLD